MSDDILSKKEKVKSFLSSVLSCFPGSRQVEVTTDETGIRAEITGEALGLFTERDGRLLEALRTICSSVINNRESEFVKFSIDADGFRIKKDERTKELAIGIAERVKAEGEAISLPDMNSYDRRIAHMALQEDPLIRTESEGEEPHRHLVVYPV